LWKRIIVFSSSLLSADLTGEAALSSSAERRVSGSLFARKMMIPNNQQQQQQPSYVEVFIPPRASIVNYFMAKVSEEIFFSERKSNE
jgi:hypothetical protein